MPPTFGEALRSPVASPHATIRAFLKRVTHPFAATLMAELERSPAVGAARIDPSILTSIGRFWSDERELELLVEPEAWREALAVAEATLAQTPPRSLLVAGEPYVGKTVVPAAARGARRAEADGACSRPAAPT